MPTADTGTCLNINSIERLHKLGGTNCGGLDALILACCLLYLHMRHPKGMLILLEEWFEYAVVGIPDAC